MKKETLKHETNPQRMSYTTYAFLRSLIEQKQQTLEKEYVKSLDFLCDEPFRSNQLSTKEKAHRIFTNAFSSLERMKKELHAAAQASYKDYPNKKIRQFWGLVK